MPAKGKGIKVDAHVVTADGTRGIVRWVGKRHLGDGQYSDELDAEIRFADEEGYLTLPVSELQRVPNPQNQRPPIEGVPAGARPNCAFCGKPLLTVAYTENSGPPKYTPLTRTFVRYGNDGVFCTTTCGHAMGRAAVKAGYKIIRK